jgi:chemotaxis regulatin CheY-phosphate phosphatase CheZ
MPDARDRLEYVARMTEQAAQRVLNATELASPLQERIHDGASELKAQWDAAAAGSFPRPSIAPWVPRPRPSWPRPAKTAA